jgi:glycosyltransferase involved in cell wall biosynthesis
MREWQAIVVDDASSDNTFDIAKNFIANASKDLRFRLIRNEINLGLSGTLNVAIGSTNSEYIAIIASDDLMQPDRLLKQVEILDASPRLGAVFSHVDIVDENDCILEDSYLNTLLAPQNHNRHEWLNLFFRFGNKLAAPSVMLRRQAVIDTGLFNVLLTQLQDFEYWIRLCMNWEIEVSPLHLTAYRVHGDASNLSSGTPQNQTTSWWEYSRILNHYERLSEAELRTIFPQTAAIGLNGLPSAALLVGIALESGVRPVRAFGLDLIYRLLHREENREALHMLGYNWKAFSRAVGQSDVFGLIEQRELKAQCEARTAEVATIRHMFESQTRELTELRAQYEARTTEAATIRDTLDSQSRELTELRAEYERHNRGSDISEHDRPANS